MTSSSRQWQRSRSRSSHRNRHRRPESVVSDRSVSKSRGRNAAASGQNDEAAHSESHHDHKKGTERSRRQRSNDSESSSFRKQKYEKPRVSSKPENDLRETEVNSLKNWWEVPPQIRRGRGRGRASAMSWDSKTEASAGGTTAGAATPEYNQAMMMRFGEIPLPHMTRVPPMGNTMLMTMRPPPPASSFEENYMEEMPEYSNVGLNFDHHPSSAAAAVAAAAGSGWIRRVPLMHPFATANTYRKGRGTIWSSGASPGSSSMPWRFNSGEPRFSNHGVTERFPPPPPGGDVMMDHGVSRIESSGTGSFSGEYPDKSITHAGPIQHNEWCGTNRRFVPRLEHQDARMIAAASMIANSSGHSLSMPLNPGWFIPRYGGFPPPPPHRFDSLAQGGSTGPQQQMWNDHINPSMTTMMMMPRRPGGTFEAVRSSNAYFSTGPANTDLQEFPPAATTVSVPDDMTAPTANVSSAAADSQQLFKACAAELEAFLDLETSRDLRIHSCYVHILDKIEPLFLSQKTYEFIRESLPEELRHKLRTVSKGPHIDVLKEDGTKDSSQRTGLPEFPYMFPVSEAFVSLKNSYTTQQASFNFRDLKDLPIDVLAEQQQQRSSSIVNATQSSCPFSHSTFEFSDIHMPIEQAISNSLTLQQQIRWQHFISVVRSSVSLSLTNIIFSHLFPLHYSSTASEFDKNSFYPTLNFMLKPGKLRDIDECSLPTLLPCIFECHFREQTAPQSNLLAFVGSAEKTHGKPLVTNRCIELALTLIAGSRS